MIIVTLIMVTQQHGMQSCKFEALSLEKATEYRNMVLDNMRMGGLIGGVSMNYIEIDK